MSATRAKRVGAGQGEGEGRGGEVELLHTTITKQKGSLIAADSGNNAYFFFLFSSNISATITRLRG